MSATTDGAGERGALQVSEKALRKIAAQSASELPFVGGVTGGVLGIGQDSDINARPKADIELSGRTAFVTLSVAMAYPSSLREGTQRLRGRVKDALESSTGITVGRVDIEITALHTGRESAGRELL
ncbi:putative alkaline shock family protein YloU [Arthrobacter sp. CAN_A212]|uniref:Asp23/Gls24 family envelope stress response protein n=1 Tax=Arthrobacter sp. CAN_A212 TaxID=2787719 RepID=UPI0018C97D9A